MSTTSPVMSSPTAPSPVGPLEAFLASLKRVRSPKTLELHQKRLQFLAQNFDPFAGEVEGECQQILQLYGLSDAAQDPFRFTNLLLQMLDALEEKGRSSPAV